MVGAKQQKLGGLGHVGLMPRQFGQAAAQRLVGHPDDAVGLQEAGAGSGLGRAQDLVELNVGDGLGSELTNGAMGENKVESRVHVASRDEAHTLPKNSEGPKAPRISTATE